MFVWIEKQNKVATIKMQAKIASKMYIIDKINKKKKKIAINPE